MMQVEKDTEVWKKTNNQNPHMGKKKNHQIEEKTNHAFSPLWEEGLKPNLRS